MKLTKILFTLFLLAVGPEIIWAQVNRLQLAGVSVQGNKTADEGLILANSGLIVGAEISGEEIQTALKNLWKLGLFSDVQILLEKEVEQGIYLVIVVTEYPRLEKVEIRGNKKLKKDELEKTLNFLPGQVLRPDQVTQARHQLLDKYATDGYLLAEVETETYLSEAAGRTVLSIKITEGKKVKIKRIIFHGNEAHEKRGVSFPFSLVNWMVEWVVPDDPFTEGKLRGQMEDTKQSIRFLRSSEFNREKFQEDLKKVVQYYQNQGYRDATITADSVQYSEDRRKLKLDIWVEEGTQYYFGNLTFTGNTVHTEQELKEKLLVHSGELYNQEKLDRSVKENLTTLYYDQGYLYINVSPLELPIGKDTIDVLFRISEGNAFKVRQIFIEGNTKTHENVIRREFVLDPGDTFSKTKLFRSSREVTLLNYFSNIIPDISTVNDEEMDLIFKVEEKSTDQVQVSAGYSERDGMIGSVGFTMPNLLGRGQRFSLDWQFGRIYRTFAISYTEPWLFQTPTLFGVSFFQTRRGGSYYGFDEDIVGGSLRLGRELNWPDDYFRIDWIYRLERAVYSNFTTSFAASNPRGLVEGEPRYSSGVTTILTRDSRDNPEFPTTGSINRYSLEIAGGPFQGNDQYHKHIFSSEWYTPILGKLVLYSNTEMGIIGALNNSPQAIPYIEQFFMGGAGLSLGIPLRGYDEREVGPQSGIYAQGGKTMFKQSVELRLPVIYNPTIYLLGFTEVGNVWYNFEQTDLFDLRRSVGLGVRLYMPMIGLIGLDYGLGLDYYDPSTGERHSEWIPHFQFGRAF